MKQGFLVIITANIPYPKTFSYVIEASAIGTALARAVKKLRVDLPKKRIKELSIKIKKL
jgi:hypothetical protein